MSTRNKRAREEASAPPEQQPRVKKSFDISLMLKVATKHKRAREEASAPPPQQQQRAESSFDISLMLKVDPKQIAAATGRHSGELLSKLDSWASELKRATSKAKVAREKNSAKAKVAAQQHQAVGKYGCQECKSKKGNIYFCADWQAGGWCVRESVSDYHHDKGSILCETCYEKKKDSLKTCAKCNLFLCDSCHKVADKCCGNECDWECGKIFCRLCSTDSHRLIGGSDFLCERDGCESWFCPTCTKKHKKVRRCPLCGTKETLCQGCYEENALCPECG